MTRNNIEAGCLAESANLSRRISTFPPGQRRTKQVMPLSIECITRRPVAVAVVVGKKLAMPPDAYGIRLIRVRPASSSRDRVIQEACKPRVCKL